MTGKPELKFSYRFEGILWNMIALPEENVLLLEVRNHPQKQVTFAALQYVANTFLWRDAKLEESWWITLGAASQGVVIFSIYIDTANPDKKGVLAYDLHTLKLLWWNNDFSLSAVSENKVLGLSGKTGIKDSVLELHSGKELALTGEISPVKLPDTLYKPVLYTEEMPHFETIKIFLAAKLNLSPVVALEYLEYDAFIFISYYVREMELANYLCVLSHAGEVLLHEKTDEQLKGIGQDTFFILGGCLFFVKNKCELISYFL